ncbi:aspartate ammonia-lyase [Chelativorans sp. YIM 93263]|uniref:aspartate ammonia-lyase n=1 Tax=Chelativorans sp. YIM 93263 TaxID=2906648 RepID=UPI002378224B|nr:aspartate ammonia-lyase [Chelativorans sp. YIM 93263]
MGERTRTARDFLGAIQIPADALYGVNTARARENFAFSGRVLGDEPAYLRAFAFIKKACAEANRSAGILPNEIAEAIAAACDELVAGKHREHFVVDMLEGTGGTATNMNVNEVLASRAAAILGGLPGDYERVHPNDHVNLSQSTNDVVPSAIKLACHEMLAELATVLRGLRDEFLRKAAEYADLMRLGRTCLQDAQPMMLGQAFGGYASLVERLEAKLLLLRSELTELPLGGTAIGTGLGSPDRFRNSVLDKLSEHTEVAWRAPQDNFDAMQNVDCFARLSGELKTCALSLAKIGSDFIILSSGPSGGLGELQLPPLQAGSSIMPGKVNPVQPMALCQASMVVAGNDTAVAMAAQQGQLEVNHYEPLIASSLFSSLRLMTSEIRLFSEKCVAGLRADAPQTMSNLTLSSAVSTAVVPRIGYERTAQIVRRARDAGVPFSEMAISEGVVSAAEMEALLAQATSGHVDRMVSPKGP